MVCVGFLDEGNNYIEFDITICKPYTGKITKFYMNAKFILLTLVAKSVIFEIKFLLTMPTSRAIHA